LASDVAGTISVDELMSIWVYEFGRCCCATFILNYRLGLDMVLVQTGGYATVVEYTYNALGRRSQKHEVLGIDDDYYYLHDHLNSVVAVVDEDGEVLERYEYDAYGKPTMWLGDYDMINDEISPYGNPYYFTGRRVDEIDNGAWLIQYNRNRFYDYYTGCRLNQYPLGYRDGNRRQNAVWGF